MKAIPQSLKPTLISSKKPRTISVGLDVFGNAIPEVRPALVEGSGGALRIVRRQDVIVRPSRKRKMASAGQTSASKALVPVSPALLGRLLPWWLQQKQAKATDNTEPAVTAQPSLGHPHPEGVGERLEYAFQHLHQAFNGREQQLEDKMRELREEHQNLLAAKPKLQAWVLPTVLLGSSAMAYMMYVMTSMQGSMTAMSGNINTMNGHIGTMAADTQSMSQNTQSMSQNMQTMNQSMYYMNHNVAYMSGNVAQMNQKVGTLAQAAAPMGEAASTVSPFMKMFKSFMPF